MQLPRSERDKAVLTQLQRLFSPFATVEEPIEIVEHIWRVSTSDKYR
jgi:monoamine oxidase